jgi:uncharacterized protein (TIGR03086 family)
MTDVADRHLQACARFTEAVRAADGKWTQPSPCSDWDARAVLEHVIGFHDVLLLRPMGAKPHRQKDDPVQRWAVTEEALRSLLERPGLFDGPVDVPAVGNNPPNQIEARPLVTMLTQDVLVHTWDLARAVGADDRLDEELCRFYLDRLPADPNALVATGMYAPGVDVPDDADAQTKLLARLGRRARA